jgi:hypothetical protein
MEDLLGLLEPLEYHEVIDREASRVELLLFAAEWVFHRLGIAGLFNQDDTSDSSRVRKSLDTRENYS